ncbi:MAG: hypothetical protein IJ735_00905 [Clostridia bacterium]|nr:hypothetical protein [Clostridia bacterium]
MKPKNKERLDTAQKVAHTGSSVLKGLWYVFCIVLAVVIVAAAVRVFSSVGSAAQGFFVGLFK